MDKERIETLLWGVIPLLYNFEMNLMPILFCYLSQVIGELKFDTFVSKMWKKNNKARHVRSFFTYLHQNLFNIKKHLDLVLKKICRCIFLCIPNYFNKAVNIFCKRPEWIRNMQMIQCFSTIETWMRILHDLLKRLKNQKVIKETSNYPTCTQ